MVCTGTDSFRDIKQWIKKNHKLDSTIPDKAKDRVLRGMAQGIRMNKSPLPSGPCHLCTTENERLAPIQLNLCQGCAKAIHKKVGGLKIINSAFEMHYCDKCFGKAFVKITSNPYVCKKCYIKIGALHKKNAFNYQQFKAGKKKEFKIR